MMNRTMKSALTALSAVALACALSACGGGGDDGNASNSGGNPDTGNTSAGGGNGGSTTTPSDPGSNNSGGGGSSSDSGSSGGGVTSYTVTPSVNGSGGTINPAQPVPVQSGATTSFTLTPDSNYTISSVDGTCGGTLNGNTYTTKSVTANCTVVASFSQTTSASASIANCFAAPTSPVAFTKVYDPPIPNLPAYLIKVTVGPATFNGKAVSGSTTVTTGMGAPTSTYSEYWTVTSSGVTMLGATLADGTIFNPASPDVWPLNTKPGDYLDGITAGGTTKRMTFLGFETLTIAGKTFSNACRFNQTDSHGTSSDQWYAAGYYQIKSLSSGQSVQYNGDVAPGGDGGSDTPPASGSIKACFTVPAAGVRYAYSSVNAPSTVYPVSAALRQVPYTYNGQSVTAVEAVATYTDNGTETEHWTITSSGVTLIDRVPLHTNSTLPTNLDLPDNMQIGQTAQSQFTNANFTFAGYENLTLAGKTFANTCRFSYSDPRVNNATAGQAWYAPGYGMIKQATTTGWILQYSGDL